MWQREALPLADGFETSFRFRVTRRTLCAEPVLPGRNCSVFVGGGGFGDDAYLRHVHETDIDALTDVALEPVLKRAQNVSRDVLTDETPRATAARELGEETQLQVDKTQLEWLR